MTCEDVRVLLAAYRRSDWTLQEQRAVGAHLTGCAACRRWEHQSRQVGEKLRQLPTITPPASLRANVYAAIRAEQEIIESQVVAQAPAALKPVAIPAAAARVGEVALDRARPPRVIFGRFAAIATMAALLMILVTTQIAPILNSGHNSPSSRGGGPSPLLPIYCLTGCTQTPYQVSADPAYPTVTSALADDKQVVYVGVSPSGQAMIIAHFRPNDKSLAVLPAPLAQPPTLLALTPQQIVWLVGKPQGTWSIQAAPLVNGSAVSVRAPITLASSGESIGSSGSVMAALSAVWASGESVLLDVTTKDGQNILAEVTTPAAAASAATATPTPAASPTATSTTTATPTAPALPALQIITRALVGHSIVDPYLDGTTAYWVDMTIGAGGIPQGTIWTEPAQGLAQAVTPATASAFGPVADGAHLAWLQVQPAAMVSQGVGGALSPALYGTLESGSASTSSTRQISTGSIASTALVRGQGFALWQENGHVQAYRLNDGYYQTIPYTGQIAALGLSYASIAWFGDPTSGSASQDVISVVDLQ